MKIGIVIFLVVALGLVLSQCGNDDDSGLEDSDTDSDIIAGDLDWWLHSNFKALVYVSWRQPSQGTVHVEYQVDGEWRSTPSFESEPGLQEQE